MSRIVCIKLHRDDAERLISALEDAAANAEERAEDEVNDDAADMWAEDWKYLDLLTQKIRAAID